MFTAYAVRLDMLWKRDVFLVFWKPFVPIGFS